MQETSVQGTFTIRNHIAKINISRVEIFLFFIVLTFGIPMVLLIPPGAGYDEEDHLVRAWEISGFSFLPGKMSPQEMQYPKIFRDFAYRHQSDGIIDSEFWLTYSGASLYQRGYVSREINTKSVYSPVLLLPQAVAMRYFGRIADLPALLVFRLTRLAGLLSYLILTWLAIRWIPFGKWLLLILAVSPMALFQASTITADTISNGLGFLFIAGSLEVAELQEIGWRKIGTLIMLVFLLFLTKLNLVVLILLPFLLISPSKYIRIWMYPFLFVISIILFAVEVVGWNIIATDNVDSLLANEASITAQLRHIVNHPLRFFQIVITDFITNSITYLQGWINGYGYYHWTPPQLVSLFFLLGLGFVLLVTSVPDWINNKINILLIVIFGLGYIATIVPIYTSFTPVGSDEVIGVQGRYFIPSAMLLFLALSGFIVRKTNLPSSLRWGIGFLVAALSINLLGIFLAFHVPCGTTFYQMGLCYQPLYKDFTTATHPSPPVSNETFLEQEVLVACDGLAELRVWLFPSVLQDGGTTRFILQDRANNRDLMDTLVYNNQITSETVYPLRFEPDWHSNGKQYILKISGINTSEEQGLRLFYAPQPELDWGSLYENGQRMPERVILQYGCMTGLRKLWTTGGL